MADLPTFHNIMLFWSEAKQAAFALLFPVRPLPILKTTLESPPPSPGLCPTAPPAGLDVINTEYHHSDSVPLPCWQELSPVHLSNDTVLKVTLPFWLASVGQQPSPAPCFFSIWDSQQPQLGSLAGVISLVHCHDRDDSSGWYHRCFPAAP